MDNKNNESENMSSIFTNEEEIAEEFGVFQTMTERDFLIFHLLKKAQEEKEKKENHKDRDDHK
ncbi:hypothetical protein DCC39_00945 [Pueribacillus theae]|uniref:Uncharacterized protein n=1 Tax=Pueribacillus theae TaxID=2171751 RepID=A0A2U1K8A0_9BACI|nr:hypothetical protein [Pueribacillus theae]PWA13489.1 hypothetical protein DCC39_00945 [Pueribacillus theae]